MTPSHAFTASACRAAAALWREDGSEPHRAFAETLDQWAAHALAREAATRSEQGELFEGMMK